LLSRTSFGGLIAQDQYDRVEALRLDMTLAALGPAPAGTASPGGAQVERLGVDPKANRRHLPGRAPNERFAGALRRRWPARYNLMFIALLC
jgi:hypothetical protein